MTGIVIAFVIYALAIVALFGLASGADSRMDRQATAIRDLIQSRDHAFDEAAKLRRKLWALADHLNLQIDEVPSQGAYYAVREKRE